jgi:3-oxoacyl-[acyl-carrier-protein] synthase-3
MTSLSPAAPLLTEHVAIEALSFVLPPHRITSADIEQQLSGTLERLGVPPGRLEALTGIQERRFWDPATMPSDVATMAAEKAIADAGIDREDIGCLINTSVCKDYIEPSVASLVHGNLKLSPGCMNYDIGNACLGFINAMWTLSLMIESGMIRYGMIVDGEGSRDVIENTISRLQDAAIDEATFRDEFATLTLGSGAAAMILSHRDHATRPHRVNGSVAQAATQYSRLCVGQPDYMKADAHAVLVHGVELALATWKLAQSALPRWSDNEIQTYIPHQVSQRNMEVLNQTLGLTPEKMHLTFQTLGNIGPAAIPITLGAAMESGRLSKGDHVGLLGIGSGLNCSMMSVTW